MLTMRCRFLGGGFIIKAGVEEDAELKWRHLKFSALKNLHQNLLLHLILRRAKKICSAVAFERGTVR